MKKFFNSIRQPANIRIDFESGDADKKLRTITVNDPNDQFTEGETPQPQTFVLFDKNDAVQGKIFVQPEKPFDHSGIKIELIGEISMLQNIIFLLFSIVF